MTDFFDLPEEAFNKPAQQQRGKKVDPNEYIPDPDAYNGAYKSVFRFVPYIFDKTKTKYSKYSAKFYNPLTKESLFIDCPSNVGDSSILWTVETVLRSLRKEEPELIAEIDKNFSRWSTNFSIVYIKKDPQRPDLEGQLKVFKYRNQVGMLIDQLMNPEEMEGLGETPKKVNPFHLLQGKDFLCIVGKKTKAFKDWTKCKFMDEVTPLIYTHNGKQVQVKNDANSVELINEFMTANSPKLDEYFHQAWTEETFTAVANALVSAIPHRNIIEMILEKSKDTKMNDLVRAKLSKAKTNNPIDDELEFKQEQPTAKVSKIDDSLDLDTPVKTTKAESKPAPAFTSDSEDDEFDDLFKDL